MAIAIKRDKWQPTKHSLVCRSHFEAADYTTQTVYGTTPLQNRLKGTAVPHIFNWSKPDTVSVTARRQRAVKRKVQDQDLDRLRDSAYENVGLEVIIEPADEVATHQETATTQTDSVQSVDISCQCTKTNSTRSVLDFVGDPEGLHYYTGLCDYKRFKLVLSTLGPARHELSYFHDQIPTMSIEDQFFLTLIKLKRHTTNFELSRDFKITENCVTNVFVTWINFMYREWSDLQWWPSRDMVRFYSPTDFRSKYPSTRVIVDGTECPIKKPKQPILQQSTFSTYKNRNTAKVLVGSTPGGLVSFCTNAYGGSASDRQIVERSALRTLCDPGDSIMADKGFNVEDLFVSSHVTINIPTFFKKKNRMSGKTVLRDRKIASKRVHIERTIGLAKSYKILCEPMNNTESNLATEIIKVCFYLTNFRPAIVPKHA